MTASIPIYRYTITLKPPVGAPAITAAHPLAPVLADAMSFREAEPWFIFDDTQGTVLTIRIDTVDSISRSPLPVRGQTVDELTDPIDPQDLT
jgi:hypothetical protein